MNQVLRHVVLLVHNISIRQQLGYALLALTYFELLWSNDVSGLASKPRQCRRILHRTNNLKWAELTNAIVLLKHEKATIQNWIWQFFISTHQCSWPAGHIRSLRAFMNCLDSLCGNALTWFATLSIIPRSHCSCKK